VTTAGKDTTAVSVNVLGAAVSSSFAYMSCGHDSMGVIYRSSQQYAAWAAAEVPYPVCSGFWILFDFCDGTVHATDPIRC
jgi:hypothetical protein